MSALTDDPTPEEIARRRAWAEERIAKEEADFAAALVADPLTVCRRMMALASTTADELEWTEKRFLAAVEATANIAAKVDEIERRRSAIAAASFDDMPPSPNGPQYTTARVPRGMTREAFEPLLIAWTATLDRDPA